jgi:hypothetical protein
MDVCGEYRVRWPVLESDVACVRDFAFRRKHGCARHDAQGSARASHQHAAAHQRRDGTIPVGEIAGDRRDDWAPLGDDGGFVRFISCPLAPRISMPLPTSVVTVPSLLGNLQPTAGMIGLHSAMTAGSFVSFPAARASHQHAAAHQRRDGTIPVGEIAGDRRDDWASLGDDGGFVRFISCPLAPRTSMPLPTSVVTVPSLLWNLQATAVAV